jgi:MurNAc alpha-1-phosphate uridylyltransferase
MSRFPAGAPPRAAMVFAAGLGTRMRPVTDTLPKPLVRVAGKALIDHALDTLAAGGVERAVVNTHYLPDMIEAHLRGRRNPAIAISDERTKLLDQGGGVKKAMPLLGGGPFVVCNTDAFWIEGPGSNLRRLSAVWDPAEMDALLLVASTTTSVGVDWRGDFTMGPDGRLARRESWQVAPFVYTGVGILKPELFADDPREVFGLAPILFDLAEKGRLRGVRLDGLWLHVGSPEAIVEAEAAIARSSR